MVGALALALLAAGWSPSPTGVDPPADVPVGLVVDVNSVQLYPVVRHHGEYVRHLTVDDFIVLEDGVPVAIDSFAAAVQGLNVIILIDLSESMRLVLPRVQAAACAFIDSLDPDDGVHVYGFSDLLVIAETDPHNHAAAKAALMKFDVRGGTRLYVALGEVLAQIDSVDDRNVVILFTDGADGTGKRPRETADLALRKGASIYPVCSRMPAEDLRARRDMNVLASWTGGESHFLVGSERLGGVFDAILDDLRAQYTLSFTPRAGREGRRRLEVKTRESGYQVRARTSYTY